MADEPTFPEPERLVGLLTELKSAYGAFAWESGIWPQVSHRRSPYRALVLFGLSGRTKDSLLVAMCGRFFWRFPTAESLAHAGTSGITGARLLVRAGQAPLVDSMAGTLASGVPRGREALVGIKGVGDKIAECVLAYGWGDDALPLDANCIRVLRRVFAPEGANLTAGALREAVKSVYRMRRQQLRELSISMVDIHEILRLHGQVCCARTPDCTRCPVSACASRRSPWGGVPVPVPPELWDDWRELINEPFPV